MTTCIIVQARMGSSRLPGKVLRPILGRPMLDHQLDRLAHVRGVDRIVVATTRFEEDHAIAECVVSRPDINLYRGEAEDVLDRYYRAAVRYNASVIVRITADCPLIEPSVIERCLALYREHRGEVDYVSNCRIRTFPRGLDTEVFGFHTLLTAHEQALDPSEREHVTPYIRRRPEDFRLLDLIDDEDHSALRWTVDTREDFQLVTRIYEALYPLCPAFGYADILALLRRHPQWAEINAHVAQKPVTV